MSGPLLDAIKEFLRIAVLAVIPLLVVQLETGNFNLKSVGVIAIIALLKAIDEFIHEKGKLEENESLTKGLTRF